MDADDLDSMPIIVLTDDTPTEELHEALVNLARTSIPLSRTRREQAKRWHNNHLMIGLIQDMLAERGDQ